MYISDMLGKPMGDYRSNKLDAVYEECARLELASDKNVWNKMLKQGIINLDTVLTNIIMTKEQAVKRKHTYAISKLGDGRVGTYIQDSSKRSGRRNIKAKNQKALIELLYDYYYPDGYQEDAPKRLCDIFDDWLEYKCRKKNNKEETRKQNQSSYQKYVKGTMIDTMALENIRAIDLEEWAINVLSKYKMTAKVFNTHKIAVTGPLHYAKRKGYITENPWVKEELEYTHLFRANRKKPSAAMVFYPDEIALLSEHFESSYQKTHNVTNLGLKVNFDLGLRVGELCALKWTDINWKNETVFIQRMEEASGQVVDYVKSDSITGYRELVLTDSVVQILKRIRMNSTIMSEFVFSDEYGKRKRKLQFINRLRRAEKTLNFETEKCTHCIRRTVASRMNASGIALDEIRRWLGHTDIDTTLKYIYNPFREDKTKELIKKNSILTTNQNCLQLSSKKRLAI